MQLHSISTLACGWSSVKDETENIAKKHGELGDFLMFQTEEPLQNFLKESKKQRGVVSKIIKIVLQHVSKILKYKVT